MTYCPNCGQQTAPNATFCDNCGCDLKQVLAGLREAKPRQQPNRSARSNGPSQSQQRPNEAGITAHAELQAERATRGLRWIGVLVVGVLLGVAGILVYQYLHKSVGMAAILIGVAIAIIGGVMIPDDRMSQGEYESLPGAVTEDGHRCIFCGGRGIYRHTPYKTNSTLADCSRCKAELWKE